jgi:ATPase subunit of ABC transporter with duplicated ATPase domains
MIGQNQLAALDEDMGLTALEYMVRRLGAEGKPRAQEEARKHLHCFAIGSEAAETAISELSGGLRVRLLLAGIFVGSPRVILLDEASNHLDGESILALAELCKTFPGAIVGISHNVAFLLSVFRDLWIIDDKGELRVQKTDSPAAFAQAFAAYALPLIGDQHRAAFADMMRIRAARSTIVAESETATTSLVI